MSTMTTHNNFSLSEFIKKNKAKIDAKTPINPSIAKDDEWRKESYDKFFETWRRNESMGNMDCRISIRRR